MGIALSATLRTPASNGTVTLNDDGSLSYQHDGSETTNDSFSYFVSDGRGANTIGTVELSIIPVNDQPVANGDMYTVDKGGMITISAPGLLSNDTDIENDSLTTELISDVTKGTLRLNADGSFTYAHDGTDAGDVSFAYRVLDGNGGHADATVTLMVSDPQVPGDFNGDDVVTVADIDLLCQAIRRQESDLLYDVDGSGDVSMSDFNELVFGVIGTTVGDSNLDGIFDSADLILVFQRNEYEDAIVGNSTWADGDWNCDGEFSSGDLVAAFQVGEYQRNAVALVSTRPVANAATPTA